MTLHPMTQIGLRLIAATLLMALVLNLVLRVGGWYDRHRSHIRRRWTRRINAYRQRRAQRALNRRAAT